MTIDMSNNRVPYGLLTDEEKAALHEHYKHAGAFKVALGEDAWANVFSPTWNRQRIYRTVPLPKTQDVIAWDRLPEWVEWVARNKSGTVWAYSDEPRGMSIAWGDQGGSFRRIDDFPGIMQIGTCGWKDSKQRRPRG
jgi:hypothetical protein